MLSMIRSESESSSVALSRAAAPCWGAPRRLPCRAGGETIWTVPPAAGEGAAGTVGETVELAGLLFVPGESGVPE